MDRLSYETLDKLNFKGYLKRQAPEKVLQFGEGNFLRAFTDYYFDMANEKADYDGKVVLLQPVGRGFADVINRQDGLYTLYLRGMEKGEMASRKRVISAVSRCIDQYADFGRVLEVARSDDLEIIVSNTTEAGICYDPDSTFEQIPPGSFPAKLTRLLYERFAAGKGGVIVLSCELIDDNGKVLFSIVERHGREWGLPEAFLRWLREENLFCSTLVDRIVPGKPKNPEEIAAMELENGYRDELLDTAEIFGVWMIEGPLWLEDRLPFRAAGLDVHVTEDVTPYKKRKVRILNGAHTGFALGAYLAGKNIVRECMEDQTVRGFMEQMIEEEIIPALGLPEEEVRAFAESVTDRFANPFIDHELLSISLNSASKWKARNLPSLLDYAEKFGSLPVCLTMSLAAYIAFYSSDICRREEGKLVCKRPAGDEYVVRDEQWVLDFFYEHRDDDESELTEAVLGEKRMWGESLLSVAGLKTAVEGALREIRRRGAAEAYASCLRK